MIQLSELDEHIKIELVKILRELKNEIKPHNPTYANYLDIKNIAEKNEILRGFGEFMRYTIFSPLENGYYYCDLNCLLESTDDLKILNFLMLCLTGEPIWLYDNKPLWFELKVKLNADPGRTHGIGENQLHVDLLTFKKPPKIISFHCIRKDPLGGGQTLLTDMYKVIEGIDKTDIDILSKDFYKYWIDEGINVLGDKLEKFPIIDIDDEEYILRFTSKMYPHLQKDNVVLTAEGEKEKHKVIKAFRNLQELSEKNKTRILLEPGQFLFFNQLRFTHGRSVLGSGQENLLGNKTRLISQSYAY